MSSAASPRRRAPPVPAVWWLDAFAVAVLAGTVAGWCGRWYWLFDLASHFRSSWLLLACTGLAACVRWPRPIAAVCLVLAALGNVGEMLPYWLPAGSPAAGSAAGEHKVVVVSMNVRRINDDPSAALAYLRARRPDVVAVLEVDDQWAEALDTLTDLFPQRIIRSRPDNFGIAVLSRWPLDDPQVVAFSDTGFPSIVATVRAAAGDFRFIATHPYPPFNARATAALGVHLAAVADAAATSPLPCIVAGDFNATPWSLPFRVLVTRSGLIDTALGRGVQATWNARYPVPRIPIDHILAPRGTLVLHREVGPDIGSDHFPVEAELVLPAK